MGGMLEKEGRYWRVGGRKHSGKKLEDVAKNDPSFLTWIWNSIEVFQYLNDEAVDALQTVMEKHKISFEKATKKVRKK